MEYTKDQKTEWNHGFAPIIEGAYEVRIRGSGGLYSWWSKNTGWGAASGSPLGASGGMYRGGNKDHYHTVGEWRGLNFNPQAPQKPAKKKGNKKVTRWMHITGMMGSELIHKVHGVYKTKREAEAARDKRNSKGWRSSIRQIRFRTPEA